jgi:hypothetical protein
MKPLTAGVWAAIVGCGLASAQATKAAGMTRTELKVEKHRLVFEYEPVAAAEGPAQRAVGATWHPGIAAALTLEAPMCVAKVVVAPGRYRVLLVRAAESTWVLRAENVPVRLDASKPAGDDLELPLTHSAAPRPVERLEAKWALAKGEKEGGQGVTLTLRIGEDVFVLRGAVWAGVERESQGWTLHGWPLPSASHAAWSAAGFPTPFVTLRHADGSDPTRTRVFNLIVCGDQIGLIEASEGPGPDGKTPPTKSPQWYPSSTWRQYRKSDRIGAPVMDVKGGRMGIYLNLTDGARIITFSILEPDYGQKK